MVKKTFFAVMLLAVVFVLGACSPDYDTMEADFDIEEDVPAVEDVVEDDADEEEADEVDEDYTDTEEDVDEDYADDLDDDAEPRVIEVSGGNYYFDPDVIEVDVGETIEFVFINEGGTHDLVIPELDVGTNIITGGEEESFVYTFDEAGTFDFECSVGSHADMGMVGEIIVS